MRLASSVALLVPGLLEELGQLPAHGLADRNTTHCAGTFGVLDLQVCRGSGICTMLCLLSARAAVLPAAAGVW
jgi:hypothetical protein